MKLKNKWVWLGMGKNSLVCIFFVDPKKYGLKIPKEITVVKTKILSDKFWDYLL